MPRSATKPINVFMGLPDDGPEPRLELTYNFGVDSYELGTGYGHIAITHRRPRRHARAAGRAGHRARAPALHDPRGRQPAVLRARPRRLPDRDHRAVALRRPRWRTRARSASCCSRSRWASPPTIARTPITTPGGSGWLTSTSSGSASRRARSSSPASCSRPTAGRPASSASCATASTTRARSRRRKRSSTRSRARSSPSRSRCRGRRPGSRPPF